MQDKIICLVGPSGAGKTTIAKELEKLGYNIIHSYTNRNERYPNEWGHTFVKDRVTTATIRGEGLEKFYMKDERSSKVIALKELYGYEYWATREQYKNKGTSIYTVCPDGAKQVQENVKDAEVVTIFLMVEEDIRFVRLMNRHNIRMSLDNTKEELATLKEIKDRRYKDREIFKTCKCNYVVDANRELEEVVKDVIEIIEGEI